MDVNCCSLADVDSSVPRARQRLVAASQIVFDAVVFVPGCNNGGGDRGTILPAASLGFRRTVPGAAVTPSCLDSRDLCPYFLFSRSFCRSTPPLVTKLAHYWVI